MILDLRAELLAVLATDAARETIAEAVRPVVAAEVKRALEAHSDTLRPLCEILKVSPDCARKRETRDPNLAALAITMIGRRRYYDAAQVKEYLRAANKRDRLRVVEGEVAK